MAHGYLSPKTIKKNGSVLPFFISSAKIIILFSFYFPGILRGQDITPSGIPAQEAEADVSPLPWRNDVPVLMDEQILEERDSLGPQKARVAAPDTLSAPGPAVGPDSAVDVNPNQSLGQGSESGIITAVENGEPIEGASVLFISDSLQFAAKSDRDGLFRIDALKPGVFNVKVYKKGFTQFSDPEWRVNPGKNPFREIRLDRKILKGALLEIKAPKAAGSGSLLLSKRQQAGVVMEGVTAEQISKSTDSDAGAIARRVTGTSVVEGKYVYVRGLGERYTNMTLNGLPVPTPEKDKRVVPQDLFPASALENFMIYKTFQPDLPPDFAGGSINLQTKGYPDKNFIKASVSAGATDYLGDARFLDLGDERLTYDGGDDWRTYLGFDAGGRAIPKGVPEIVTPAGYTDEEIAEIARRFNNTWGVDTAVNYPSQGYSLSAGRVYSLNDDYKTGFLTYFSFKNKFSQERQFRTRVGESKLKELYPMQIGDSVYMVGRMVYDTVNGVSVPLRIIAPGIEQEAMRGRFRTTSTALVNWGLDGPNHHLWFKSLYANLSDDKTVFNHSVQMKGGPSLGQDQPVEERFLLEYERRSILSGQFGGGHFMGFSALDSCAWAAGLARTHGEIPDSRKYYYVRIDSTTIRYEGKPPYGTRQFDDFNEIGAAGRFDAFLIVPPNWSRSDLFLQRKGVFSHLRLPRGKSGVQANFKRREYDILRYAWDMDTEFNTKDTTNNYRFVETLHHPDSVYKRVVETGSGFKTTPSQYDNYTAHELNLSGYGGLDFSFRLLGLPVELNGGVRYELFYLNFHSPYTDIETIRNPELREDSAIIIDKLQHLWYPSASIGIEFLPKTKTRLLYSKTVVKPELRERAPLFFFDSEEEIEVIGNPRLRDTRIHNFDLRFDWFLPYQQVFSLSGFYKKFFDPIEYIVDYNLSPNRKKFQNAEGALLYGAEIEFDANLGRWLEKAPYIGGAAAGLRLYVNAAWIKSRVEIDTSQAGAELQTSKSRSLVGQSPYLYNLKLTHEQAWFNRLDILNGLLFNVSGRRIRSVGIFHVADTYEEAFPSLDYLAKATLGRHEWSFKIQNLMNSKKLFTISEFNHEKKYLLVSDARRDSLYADYPRKFTISREVPGVSYSLDYSVKF